MCLPNKYNQHYTIIKNTFSAFLIIGNKNNNLYIFNIFHRLLECVKKNLIILARNVRIIYHPDIAGQLTGEIKI